MRKKTFETRIVFHNARKYLDRGKIQAIYTQTSRQFDRWAADSRYCAVTARNPLDRLEMLLAALDDAGKGDVARAAVDWLAQSVGGRFCNDPADISEPGQVDSVICETMDRMSSARGASIEALKDGVITTEERIRIKHRLREFEVKAAEFVAAIKARMEAE